MYDIIIIGGGISSLYFCYRLINVRPNLKILILDKNNRLGGKVYTGEYNDYKYELGAGRFRKSHELLMNLLRELELENKLIENSTKVEYYVNYKKKNKEKIKHLSLIEKAINDSGKKKDFYRYSIYQILKKNLKKKELTSLINTSPYLGEYYLQNAESFINNSLEDFYSNKKYFSLKGGLSQIIRLLKSYLTNLVDIHINEECTSIKKTKNGFFVNGNKEYLTKKVIIAVSPKNAKKIDGIPQDDIFMDIYYKLNPVALYRIYAIYPKKKGKVWFQDINRIVTNSPLQTIIPINKDTGLIMISYSDYRKAIAMNKEKDIEKLIKDELHKLFPEKDIPSPDFITGYFWDDGVNYWKPGYRGKIESKKSIEPIKNIYLMGEAYSNYQGWMEGGLQSALSVYKHIYNMEENANKIKTRNKEVSLDELSKHNSKDDAWIGLNGNVYDVTSFIPKHPGGTAILKGIGKEYTRQWEKISSHRMNRDRINNILSDRLVAKLSNN